MHGRIARHQNSLDLNSPAWRTEMTLHERQTLLMTWLDRTVGRLPVPGVKTNRIVASHRGEAGTVAHHVD
jgi:hypothetical protein